MSNSLMALCRQCSTGHNASQVTRLHCWTQFADKRCMGEIARWSIDCEPIGIWDRPFSRSQSDVIYFCFWPGRAAGEPYRRSVGHRFVATQSGSQCGLPPPPNNMRWPTSALVELDRP